MLNSSLKKDAVEKLKKAIEDYEKVVQKARKSAIFLHKTRTAAVETIESIEGYINSLANTPKEFEKTFEKVNFNINSFKILSEIEYDEKTMIKIAGGGAAAGTAAGVATAALAPTAAMAIATTFGTASTGAAISTLSGAAATNAALAWLGGGALAAGGGGMAAGNTLLALAGPIGWGIGAVSLTAGGIFASKKNKEAAIKADKERTEIIKNMYSIQASTKEINRLEQTTENLSVELSQSIRLFINKTIGIKEYLQFESEQKKELMAIINNTRSLSELFMKEIGK